MTRPPNTPPNSDIDGIHEDSKHPVDAARKADQDASDLEQARRQSIGRPDRDRKDAGDRDDRSG